MKYSERTFWYIPPEHLSDGSVNPDYVRYEAEAWAIHFDADPDEMEALIWKQREREERKMRRRRRGGFWRNLFRGEHDPGSEMGPGPVSSWYGRR